MKRTILPLLLAGLALPAWATGAAMMEFTYPGYLTTTAVQVGTMNPDRSISEITDVSGLVGGQPWGSLIGTPYARVDTSVIDGGSTLCVQFKQAENASMIKCVIVHFTKDSEGAVYAKVAKACYKNTGTVSYDYDFVNGTSHTDYADSNIATADDKWNTGVKGLSFKAPSPYVFNSSTVTDLVDANGWARHVAASAGEPAIVAGAGTAAIMHAGVPAYSEILVEDGASLCVAATRDLPATTLEAGTVLLVTNALYTTEEIAYAPYLTTNRTLVGTMAPGRSITEITDVQGLVGGQPWGSLIGTPYARVDTSVIDGGSTLCVQFKQAESASMIKCVIVHLTNDQEGNVYAKVAKACYKNSGTVSYDYDFVNGTSHADYADSNIATADDKWNTGVKGLSFKAPVVPHATTYTDRSYEGYVLAEDTLVGTMDPGQGIDSVTNIAGHIGGSAWAASLKGAPYSRVDVSVVDNGAKLLAQFKQWESPYLKCVIVEFTKNASGDIYAKATRAAYVQQSSLDYDFDFSGGAGNINSVATADSGAGNYGVKDISFQISSEAPADIASTVTAVGPFATAGTGSAMVGVAAGCVLDLSGVVVTNDTATIIKTGLGTVVAGEGLRAAVRVAAGTLALPIPAAGEVVPTVPSLVVEEDGALAALVPGLPEGVACVDVLRTTGELSIPAQTGDAAHKRFFVGPSRGGLVLRYGNPPSTVIIVR